MQLPRSLLLGFALALSTSQLAYPADSRPNLDAFRLELAATLPVLLERFRIPGTAVAVIHDGEVVFREGFGFTSHSREIPITPGTVFNVASISKTVSAVGAMHLVERDLLDLDLPMEGSIRGWRIPASPTGSEITLRRLLSHTAGLSVGAIGTYIVGHPMPSLVEALDGSNGRGRVEARHPVDEFHYSGGGYGVVQLLIEEAVGRAFADFMKSEILTPLGMHSSSYRWAEIADTAAVPHEAGMAVEPVTHVLEAAGSLQTTIDDLAAFLRFVLGITDGPLDTATLDLMQQGPFGLGFNVSMMNDRKVVAHGAGNRGWSGQFGLFPEQASGVVILTNGSSGTDITNAVLYAWTRHFHHFDLGQVPANEPAFPIDVAPSILAQTVGSYRAKTGLVWDFRLVDGHLEVHADGANTRVYARTEDEFFIYPLSGSMSFRFEYDPDGKAIAALVRPRNGSNWARMPHVTE